jgi:hypothetical protein
MNDMELNICVGTEEMCMFHEPAGFAQIICLFLPKNQLIRGP